MRIRVAWLCLFLAAPSFALAESTPHWLQVRSDHFIVISDSSDQQARHVAAELEGMRLVLTTLLPHGGNDAGPPIVVLALKDRKSFESLEYAGDLGKGQPRFIGFFMRTPGTNYILLELNAHEPGHPFSSVYHEYTHYIMRNLKWMPIWLSEGLAGFHEDTEIHDKRVSVGQPSQLKIWQVRHYSKKFLALTTLFTVEDGSPYLHDKQKTPIFYAESWALVYYIQMTDLENKTARLNLYAEYLAKHEDPVTAAQHAFGDLSKLQEELEDYVSKKLFKGFNIERSFEVDEASLHSTPVSLNDVNAIRARVLAFANHQPEAKSLAEAVLRDDPKNVLAMEAMGSICTLQRDSPCAKKWDKQAAELDSQNPFVLYSYAADAMMVTHRSEDDRIESSLKRSIQLDPTFAPAYDALASFYVMHNEKLDEAHQASIRAIELDPEELAYRLRAASLLVIAKNYDGALKLLRAAQPSFRSYADANMLAVRIQQLEQDEAQMHLSK